MGYAIAAKLNKEMDGNIKLHRFRYHMASGFITKDDTVMDLGCGTGYGSYILAEHAKKLFSFDMEKQNIDSCIHDFQRSNIDYQVADLEKIDLPESDISVMFEVLEHLYKPGDFAKKLKKATKKYLVMSVPLYQTLEWDEEKQEYHEKGDHTHKSVFPTEESFLELFVDDVWKVFFSFRIGVTFICIFYNTKE